MTTREHIPICCHALRQIFGVKKLDAKDSSHLREIWVQDACYRITGGKNTVDFFVSLLLKAFSSRLHAYIHFKSYV
jgi:hypothetical protein